MRKILVFIAPVLVIASGFAVVIAMHAAQPAPEKNMEPPRPLSLFVTAAKRQPVTLSVKTEGEVRPLTEIDLVPQVSGRIVYVSPQFTAGGTIAAGETLIKIDDADYRLAVVRAEAQVAAAKLELSRQEASAAIVKKQWQWDQLGKEEPTDLGLRKPQVAEARAKYRSAQAELESARLNLARTEIKVPFHGRVREKMADIGQYVGAGAKLGRAFSTEKAEIRLPLTDAQLAKVGIPIAYNAGAHAGPEVRLSATVGGQTHHWTGHIRRTDAAIDSSTRLYYAIAEIDDPYGRGRDGDTPLAMGLFVDANIEGRKLDSALVIPRAALRTDDRVYIVNGAQKLEVRTVQIASSSPERVVLTAGLTEGDHVVISPVRSPVEGMAVAPITEEEQAQIAAQGQVRPAEDDL